MWNIAVETDHKGGMGHLDNKKSMCVCRQDHEGWTGRIQVVSLLIRRIA